MTKYLKMEAILGHLRSMSMEMKEGSPIKAKAFEKKNKLIQGRWADLDNNDTVDDAAEISAWWR